MPDVIWDALWNGAANTADSAIPAADWADNQRAHQYNGGVSQTYGGDATGPKKLTTTGNLTGVPVAVQAGGGAISVFADTTSGVVLAVTQSAVGGAATRSTSLAGHAPAPTAASTATTRAPRQAPLAAGRSSRACPADLLLWLV